MADHQLVTLTQGPTWDAGKPRREQAQWQQHAAFMDELTAEGIVVLAGPVGDVDRDDVVVVLELRDEDAVRARLAPDPWIDTILSIKSIQPWTIWLRRP